MKRNNLNIESIHPKNGEKFSPNLHKFMKRLGKEALAQPEKEPVAGLNAVDYQNNRGGEKYRFAHLNEKGEWIYLESGASLIEGDEIIKTWPLTSEAVAPQRTWVGLMRGVRVDGDTVVITVKGGNDVARKLCGELLKEKNT